MLEEVSKRLSLAQRIVCGLQCHNQVRHAVTDDGLARLAMLYGKNAINALPLVTAGRIVCVRAAQSGRELYKVEASGKEDVYRVLLREYCECPAYFSLLCKGEGTCVRLRCLSMQKPAMSHERAQTFTAVDTDRGRNTDRGQAMLILT